MPVERRHTERGRAVSRLIGGVLWLAALGCCGEEPDSIPVPILDWRADERVLVLAPHPGDETIGCGATIRHLVDSGVPVRVAFLTCGEHSQWSLELYRARLAVPPDEVSMLGPRRMREAQEAAAALGLKNEDLIFLGFPDFGTLNIWCGHWAEAMPFRSMLTRTREVPYAEALHPGAPYKGEVLLADLKDVIRDFRPTRILVSHPADQHPDHQAFYLFTRVALWDLADEPAPELLPYLVHYTDWPAQGAEAWHRPPPDLARAANWRGVAAADDQAAARDRAIAAHQTDEGFSSGRLRQFARRNDLYGEFPDVLVGREPILLDTGDAAQILPENLYPEEKDRYVGIERRAVCLEEDALKMDLRLNRALEQGMGVSVYIFGYHPDRPFEHMPKLHICLKAFSVEVLDQARPWPPGGLSVKKTGPVIQLRIPLAALGSPDRVLTGARTYLNEVPLNWAPWRVLRISPAGESSSRAGME